jgi:hypothetical protein
MQKEWGWYSHALAALVAVVYSVLTLYVYQKVWPGT